METKPKMIFLDVKPAFHYPVRRSSGFQVKKNSIALYGTDTRPSLASISSTGKFKKDIVFSNIGASHYFLRCIGAMPVSWPTPGNAFFSFSSMPFAYSFLVFVLLAAYVGYVAVSRIQIVSSVKGPFEEAVIAYLFLVNILPIFIVPIMWSESQKIANLMNDWNDFEILYYQITGHIVPLKIKTKAKTITFLLPLLSILSVMISHTTMAKFNLVEDVVFSNIGASHYFLRCIGSMPITRPTPGNATFSLGSISFAYSFLFFAFLTAYVGYVAVSRVHIVSSLKGPFEEAVIAYLFLVNILPIILIPIIWSESTKIANLMNDWNDFEILYFQISGHSVPLQLKRKAVVITMVLPVLSILSVVITHISMADFHLVQVIPYCILDNLTAMLGAWWYLSCEALSDTANILAERFQKALRHIGPAAMVADYRALWLRLSKLTRDTGTATCYTFTFLNLYLFFIITLSIYGLMSQLSEGFGTKDIGLAITALWSIGLLFFICDEAHYASHNVRTNFQKKLLMVELNWMNSDAQTEINMFLRATEMNPSNINCGGFFDVNRNLFKGLLTTMVTYLVVLLQFQISIPDGKQKGNLTLIDTGSMMNGTDSGMHMTPH